MTREENLVRATTQAIAATVSDVPPLRLEQAAEPAGRPSPEAGASPERLTAGHRVRPGQPPLRGASRRPAGPGGRQNWRTWLVPAAAAIGVVVLAITLVTIKEITNGGVANGPAPAVTPPGGVPQYYVAIRAASAASYAPNEMVVGDDVTGKTLATLPAQADTAFESVTAAANDRTFVVLDVANPNPKDRGLGQADSWFEVKLAPGTATPVRLVYSPIEPLYGVVATALSASGKELAVATVDTAGGQRGSNISVYSLVHSWYTNDHSKSIFTSLADGSSVTQYPALTWIDHDRAIAFTTQAKAEFEESVRVVNVAGPRDGGDLMAKSRVIWSLRQPATGALRAACQNQLPVVSSDGKTIVCVGANVQPSPASPTPTWMLTWITSEETRAAAHGTIAYRVTKGTKTSFSAGVNFALWANSSGSTIIGEWAVDAINPPQNPPASTGSAEIPLVDPLSLKSPHFGVISHGKFTPLNLPAVSTVSAPQQIAW